MVAIREREGHITKGVYEMEKGKMTQKQEVLNYMKTHKRGITSFVAFERFGITRLADIIFKLRQEGFEILTEQLTTKNRYGHVVNYARYSLA